MNTDNRRNVMQSKLDENLLLERDAQIASREKKIAVLTSLLKRALPVILKDAQNGSSDSEQLHREIEQEVGARH